MPIRIISESDASLTVEAVLFLNKTLLHPLAQDLSANQKKRLQEILNQSSEGPWSDSDLVPLDDRTLLLLDAGKEKGVSSLENIRCLGYRLALVAEQRHLPLVSVNLVEATDAECAALISGIQFGQYHFELYKSKPKKRFVSTIEIVAGAKAQEWSALQNSVESVMVQVAMARNLVNEPGSSLTPQAFVSIAQKLGRTHGLTMKVRNATQLQKEGFNGLISVGKGSPNPPAMVTLQYKPRKTTAGVHLGIVGKGLTFDTGGISLKPATDMWEMKMDMAGAAATLGAICAIADLKLPIHVTAVLCIAENRPSGVAQLPGDIFKAKNGKTVMVDNTDAEGRLVLTDGLWEIGQYGVTHVVDLATLTGAIIRALGNSVAGLFTNSPAFGEVILQAGKACGEKFWPMPLESEYSEGLKDKVADLRNVSGEAGAVTAALFLNEFVPAGVSWSHWDIAGTAFTTKKWKYIEHGATGFGVQSLVELARLLISKGAKPPHQS